MLIIQTFLNIFAVSHVKREVNSAGIIFFTDAQRYYRSKVKGLGARFPVFLRAILYEYKFTTQVFKYRRKLHMVA